MRWKQSGSLKFYDMDGTEMIRVYSHHITVYGIRTENPKLIIDNFMKWLKYSAKVDVSNPRNPPKKNWKTNLRNSLYPNKQKPLEIVVDSYTALIFKYNGDIILHGKLIGVNCAIYDGICEALKRNKK